MVRFRPTISLAGLAACALLAGCKYSNTAPPLNVPCPGAAATLAPGIVTEYGVPTASSKPYGITTGPDGNLWFTEAVGNKVGKVTTSGSFTEYPLPGNAVPLDIVKGPAGNQAVWFVENGTSQIGTINTGTGTLTQFALPSSSSPSGLAVDQSGVLWFAEFNLNTIAKITTSGSVTPYANSGFPGGQPDAVAIAPDNTVWFLDFFNNAVGHLTFPGGSPTFAEFSLSAGAAPEFITVGADGNLWVTEGAGGIARVVPSSGAVTEYALPTQANFCLPDGALPFGITSSPADGDVWFGEADAGQVGRITPGGVITEYGIPGSGTTAVDVTWGPDSNLWFTDSGVDPNVTIGANRVGKINISGIPALQVHREQARIVRKYTWRKIPAHGDPHVFERP